MEFGLNGDDPVTGEVVRMHPEETLALLASCIGHEQRHGVFGLNKILDHIIESRSELQRDHRMRRLRRLAKD
jgi:hypothetical protein